LHSELFPNNEISRDSFEEVLGAMARAELLTFADAVFEKDGKQIPYRTLSLTATGRMVGETTPIKFVMKDTSSRTASRKSRKKASKSEVAPNASRRNASKLRKTAPAEDESETDTRMEQALRTWRLREAKRRKIPAFRIFGDKALRTIAQICPTTDAELLTVLGIGMNIVQKYGAQIYHLVESSS
jgi:DNA topoisomerase-3